MCNFWRIAAVFIMMLALVACSSEPTSGESGGDNSAPVSIDAPAMDTGGLDAYLADNGGRPVILLFWTTWCPSCKHAMPELEKLRASYSENDLAVVAVSLDENRDALLKYLKDKPLDLPVYHGSNDLAQRFNVSAIPTLVAFAPGGKPVFAKAGVFPHDMLVKLVDQLAAMQ